MPSATTTGSRGSWPLASALPTLWCTPPKTHKNRVKGKQTCTHAKRCISNKEMGWKDQKEGESPNTKPRWEKKRRHNRDTGKHISWIFGVHTEFRVKGWLVYLPNDIRVETERRAGALQSVITEYHQTTEQQQQRVQKIPPQLLHHQNRDALSSYLTVRCNWTLRLWWHCGFPGNKKKCGFLDKKH